MANTLVLIIRLLRIKQWVKNAFIFFPLIFSGRLFIKDLIIDCGWAFLGFSLISSSLYILNDFLDMREDLLHPKKAKRPLAQQSFPKGIIFFSILFLELMGLLICKGVGELILFIGVIYILIHLIYNFLAKRIVIIDVLFIALGFHLRIWSGAFAAQTFPSVWLQLCVFLLALFLGFTKRRYEIATLKEKAHEHRKVLAHYTSYLLDQIIIICSTLAIVFYGLYTISTDIINRIGNNNMIYSLVFVIYGIFRYLYLVHVRKLGDDPSDVLFHDLPLLFNILLWILYVSLVIYLPRFYFTL